MSIIDTIDGLFFDYARNLNLHPKTLTHPLFLLSDFRQMVTCPTWIRKKKSLFPSPAFIFSLYSVSPFFVSILKNPKSSLQVFSWIHIDLPLCDNTIYSNLGFDSLLSLGLGRNFFPTCQYLHKSWPTLRCVSHPWISSSSHYFKSWIHLRLLSQATPSNSIFNKILLFLVLIKRKW